MSRNTPSGVARLLRQEAGFGCCVCGNPIIQYHHIVEWADDQHFRPDDMMVLCPTHHDQASKGAMPEPDQRRYKANPSNIKTGRAKGLLEVRQDYCAANFGSVTVVGDGPFLRIGGEDILSFYIGDRNLEISLRLFSEQDELLLEIERNEWVAGDPLPWDIEADWQRLTLRERARRISLSLDARPVPLELRGDFWRAGNRVQLTEQGVIVNRANLKASGVQELALVGMTLDVDPTAMTLLPSALQSDAAFVSWPNRRERLWRAKDTWRKIKGAREAGST